MTTPEQEKRLIHAPEDWRHLQETITDLQAKLREAEAERDVQYRERGMLSVHYGNLLTRLNAAEATIAALRKALVDSDSMLSLLRHRHINWQTLDRRRPEVGEVDAVIGRSRAALGREG